MITRLVKLTISEDKIQEFERIFVSNQDKISKFPGCVSVKVLRDINQPNVYFTYSIWKSEEAINNYRKSELFGSIWPNAKKTFCEKPEAWSLV
ncbi:MAG: antibiotic biosynthesis monooxygenase [Flavobacteriales bacterium]|nr:antibiotic biosynthesis monooxygenase [Flavobacteriales bacterium]